MVLNDEYESNQRARTMRGKVLQWAGIAFIEKSGRRLAGLLAGQLGAHWQLLLR